MDFRYLSQFSSTRFSSATQPCSGSSRIFFNRETRDGDVSVHIYRKAPFKKYVRYKDYPFHLIRQEGQYRSELEIERIENDIDEYGRHLVRFHIRVGKIVFTITDESYFIKDGRLDTDAEQIISGGRANGDQALLTEPKLGSNSRVISPVRETKTAVVPPTIKNLPAWKISQISQQMRVNRESPDEIDDYGRFGTVLGSSDKLIPQIEKDVNYINLRQVDVEELQNLLELIVKLAENRIEEFSWKGTAYSVVNWRSRYPRHSFFEDGVTANVGGLIVTNERTKEKVHIQGIVAKMAIHQLFFGGEHAQERIDLQQLFKVFPQLTKL